MQIFIVYLSTRIWQLTVINLTMLGLILLGLIITGFAPAAVAGLWATAHLDEYSAGDLFRGIWKEYRQAFLPANALVLPQLTVLALFITAGLYAPGVMLAVVLASSVLLLAFTIASLVVKSRINASTKDTLFNAKMAFLLAPYRHLFAIVLLPLFAWAIWQQPMLGLYFGLSLYCWLLNELIVPAIQSHFPELIPIVSARLRHE